MISNFNHFIQKKAYFSNVNQDYLYRKLRETIPLNEPFSRESLLNFYRIYEPELEEEVLGWRIFDLKRKGIIASVKKGVYRLTGKRQLFKPALDESLLQIVGILETSFDHSSFSIWNTSWLNEFLELQAVNNMIILEAEKSSAESIFYHLRDKGQKNIFFKPDEVMLDRYISEHTESIIVKALVSRAPIKRIDKVPVATLEKILVDLFCDEKLYISFQGSQLKKIYHAAIEKYNVDFSKLLNYARRRNREEEVKRFLINHLKEQLINIIE